MCDKFFTHMLALIMSVPPYGSIQTKANESSYQAKCPGGFSSYEICIYKAHNIYLQTPHPLHLLPNSIPM